MSFKGTEGRVFFTLRQRLAVSAHSLLVLMPSSRDFSPDFPLADFFFYSDQRQIGVGSSFTNWRLSAICELFKDTKKLTDCYVAMLNLARKKSSSKASKPVT